MAHAGQPSAQQAGQAGAPSAGAFLAAAGLAAIAGWVDAAALLGLHAFVANMTGAVVMLGLAAADADWGGAGRQAATVLGFFSGVVASRLLRRLGHGPAPSYVIAAAIVAACMGPAGADHAGVVLLAAAMGLQNAAGTVFGGVGMNTVFLTGNLQRLGETLADPIKPGARRRFALGLLPSVLLAYALGAGGGGLAMRHLPQPLLPPALALAAAAGIAAARARPARIQPASVPSTAAPTVATFEAPALEAAALDRPALGAFATAAAPAGRTPPR